MPANSWTSLKVSYLARENLRAITNAADVDDRSTNRCWLCRYCSRNGTDGTEHVCKFITSSSTVQQLCLADVSISRRQQQNDPSSSAWILSSGLSLLAALMRTSLVFTLSFPSSEWKYSADTTDAHAAQAYPVTMCRILHACRSLMSISFKTAIESNLPAIKRLNSMTASFRGLIAQQVCYQFSCLPSRSSEQRPSAF